MRKRLLVATVGTVAIGVLLLGLPLAVAVRGVLTTQAFETLQRQAEQVQVLFNQQQLSGTERRDLLHDLLQSLLYSLLHRLLHRHLHIWLHNLSGQGHSLLCRLRI